MALEPVFLSAEVECLALLCVAKAGTPVAGPVRAHVGSQQLTRGVAHPQLRADECGVECLQFLDQRVHYDVTLVLDWRFAADVLQDGLHGVCVVEHKVHSLRTVGKRGTERGEKQLTVLQMGHQFMSGSVSYLESQASSSRFARKASDWGQRWMYWHNSWGVRGSISLCSSCWHLAFRGPRRPQRSSMIVLLYFKSSPIT